MINFFIGFLVALLACAISGIILSDYSYSKGFTQGYITAKQLKDLAEDDLIKRPDAIDAIESCEPGEERFMKTSLPSAQPTPNWIPCNERLPEDYTDVLVWFEYFRYGDYNCLYQTYGVGNYSTEYDSWMINHETGWHKLRVIAWMPLPETYKEGEQDG